MTETVFFEDAIARAWELLDAGDVDGAGEIFRRLADESVRPQAAEIGLLAMRLRREGAEAVLDDVMAMAAECPGFPEAWRVVADVSETLNPEAAPAARQCAAALARLK